MGTFFTHCEIENFADRGKSVKIPKILVDTGSEYTWISGSALQQIGILEERKELVFVMENGERVTRSVGFAIIRHNEYFTVDEVV
ncbi:MAG: hypothetical protein ACE5IY_10820, partial [bacterium]